MEAVAKKRKTEVCIDGYPNSRTQKKPRFKEDNYGALSASLAYCCSLVAAFLSVRDVQRLALASKEIRKEVLPSLATLKRVKEVWWHGVPKTWIPTERFAPFPQFPGLYVLHLYERKKDEKKPEQCGYSIVKDLQQFKQRMGRPYEDHLGGTAPGAPQRLHLAVAFLQKYFQQEQVSYSYDGVYTHHTFHIHVKKGGESVYLICKKRASNITYTSGLFARSVMEVGDNASDSDGKPDSDRSKLTRRLFGEGASDSEDDNFLLEDCRDLFADSDDESGSNHDD